MDILLPITLLALGFVAMWAWLVRRPERHEHALGDDELDELESSHGAAFAELVDRGVALRRRVEAVSLEVREQLAHVVDYAEFPRTQVRRERELSLSMSLHRLLEDVAEWLKTIDALAGSASSEAQRLLAPLRERAPLRPGVLMLRNQQDTSEVLARLDEIREGMMAHLHALLGWARMPRPLVIDDEDGWINLTLTITRVTPLADATLVDALALVEGGQVGLQVRVQPRGEPQELIPGVLVTPAIVTLHSRGPESDALLQLLAHHYGIGNAPRTMIEALQLTALALAGDPAVLAEVRTELKLFYEHEDEELAFEVYVTIDAKGGWLTIAEKDDSYRAAIVTALTGSSQ